VMTGGSIDWVVIMIEVPGREATDGVNRRRCHPS
jgi:hypothetical protein